MASVAFRAARGETNSDVLLDAFVDGFTIGTVAADVAYLAYREIAWVVGKLKAWSKLGAMAEREAAEEAIARGSMAGADGFEAASFETKQEALAFIRSSYPEGTLRSSMLRFFRPAGRATNLEIRVLESGGYRLHFFKAARNIGYGKLHVAELNEAGVLLRECKDTIGPLGQLIERKWIHGGP